MTFLADTILGTFAQKLKGEKAMKTIDKYVDVLTVRLLERAVKEMLGIASRLTFCGECVYFNRKTDTLGTCERGAEGTKTEDDFCSNGEAKEEEE